MKPRYPVRAAALLLLFSLAALLSISPRRSHAGPGLKVEDKTTTESLDKDGKSKGKDTKDEETKASCA